MHRNSFPQNNQIKPTPPPQKKQSRHPDKNKHARNALLPFLEAVNRVEPGLAEMPELAEDGAGNVVFGGQPMRVGFVGHADPTLKMSVNVFGSTCVSMSISDMFAVLVVFSGDGLHWLKGFSGGGGEAAAAAAAGGSKRARLQAAATRVFAFPALALRDEGLLGLGDKPGQTTWRFNTGCGGCDCQRLFSPSSG
jgi:hypothetical protein